jgi:hypothetical protein
MIPTLLLGFKSVLQVFQVCRRRRRQTFRKALAMAAGITDYIGGVRELLEAVRLDLTHLWLNIRMRTRKITPMVHCQQVTYGLESAY